MSTLITGCLIEFARSGFRLDWDGIHGAPHWSLIGSEQRATSEHLQF